MKYCFRLVSVVALSAIMGCATTSVSRNPSADRGGAVSFSDIKTQLDLPKGQTYLGFMQTKVNPALNALMGDLTPEENKDKNQFSQWQNIWLGQTPVPAVGIRINSDNYFFNLGYHDGKNPTEDIKSGRSYGVYVPTNHESDPSDVAYLTELDTYLKSAGDAAPKFYQAILKMLLACDASGWDSLTPAGQQVATDFMAIYTAENDRHIMVNLRPSSHPWEIDLAAATFLSEFVEAAGKMYLNGKIVPGKPETFWQKGKVGSGIGETRNDRIKLQQVIGDYMQKNHPDVVSEVDAIIGQTRGDDIVQGVFEYLNTANGPKSLSPQQQTALMDGLIKYIQVSKAEATQIAATMK